MDAMRRLKSFLRSTMKQTLYKDAMLLYMHKEKADLHAIPEFISANERIGPPMYFFLFPMSLCHNKQFGRVKYSLLSVDTHGIQWRGVCNNSFIIHLHRISGGEKI